MYTYPDVMVAETPLIFAENRRDTITNTILIAEILSERTTRGTEETSAPASSSTEKYDRGDKFRMYRTIPSFREYLLISQTAMQVEKFAKNNANQCVLSEYAEKDAKISFESFDFEISLDELYDRVDLDNL